MGSESPVSIVISVNGVVPMDISSLEIVFHTPLEECLILIECLALTCDEKGQKYQVVPVLPSSSGW